MSLATRIRTCGGLWLLTAAGLLSGCNGAGVHRRMTIRSEPAGALVLVEGEEVGHTPLSLDFTYYGTREFTLIKDGYETLTVMQKVPTPFYERVPFDFVSENLNPFKIRNYHNFTYKLQQQQIVGDQELRQRAEELRGESQVAD